MLRIETADGIGTADGTVRIEGDATDLLALAMWLRIAAQRGTAQASYASGVDEVVRFEIVCTEPMRKLDS